MQICYCEDEPVQAMMLKKQIEKWSLKNKAEVHVELFQSAEEFCFKGIIENFDLIFLDITMSGMDGMALARQIRRNNQEVVIVFVTSDPGFVFKGYEVGAYRYLLKPIDIHDLSDILAYVMNRSDSKTADNIVIRIENENRKLNLQKVVFIEVQGHYVNIHMDNEEIISLKSSFDNVLELVNSNSKMFFAAHRSYAVNISKVKRIGRTECVLDSGASIPVSRTAYKNLNEAFIQFFRHNMQ